MVSCEAPIEKLNYIFSCHLFAQVQVKIGKLEGERSKPNYRELLENPVLNYSGVFQHLDLYITAQLFANDKPLCIPVKTSYKYIEKKPWMWDEWLTLPLKISDLPRNSQLALTAWDIESPQRGDIPVCGATISLFDKFGEFRQGPIELRMWPNKVADGNSKSTTPGILSDAKELELEEKMLNQDMNTTNSVTSTTTNGSDEFPILDELDRLARMSKFHSDGHMIKQDWLDKLTLKEIQNATKREKQNSKFFYMNIEFAQIRCDDVKYVVLYYEEDADRILQTMPVNEMFVVNDPELELDNIIELKNRKLEHSKQMGLLDMNLKPDTESKNLLTKIVNYPVTRTLKREEQTLMWKYRYYLTQNKKALTKFLQCFDLNLEFEGKMLMELMLKWQPMDIEDALELLGSKYKNHSKIRSYAISRLRLASNDDLILYLLQLVQALKYENFSTSNQQQNLPSIKSFTTNDGSLTLSSTSSNKTTSTTTSSTATKNNIIINNNNSNSGNNLLASNKKGSFVQNELIASVTDQERDNRSNFIESTTSLSNQQVTNSEYNYSTSPPLVSQIGILGNRPVAATSESATQNIFDSNLKSFLLQRATQNELVALCLYWFVKVEIKDTRTLTSSSSNSALTATSSTSNLIGDQHIGSNSNANDSLRSNFQIFMDELLDSLRNGDANARSIYESIINQEKFLKHLNDVVRATSRESGVRDKKVIKLHQFLYDTSKSTFDLVNLNTPVSLIVDPAVKITGTYVEKSTIFKSNLMPCKFVFRTVDNSEYSVIYKIGDDLRQDQLVLQMIALMDKLLKQENLDLKLTPYKVIATGIKEGFLQFVDALPVSNILANSEYLSIKEYLRKNNPSETDKYGIAAEAMDNYVRSCAGYMVITYILGIGDRHYDNILVTKCGKILHIDFGYILGRDPKPFQPIIKWTKDMADGMGGKYGPDGKENKEYEDFKRYCYNAFLHLRRHANLILNLFSLMVDANIPDIALEPDKTVKKLIDRFKLDLSDDQASAGLIKEIENNYDSILGNITDIIHTYSTAKK